MLGDGGISDSALTQNLDGVCKLQILELENNDIHATGMCWNNFDIVLVESL